MASYETAEALQTYVNKKVKKINDLIQNLPDISGFEDVIDDISDVSEYLSELAGNTDGKVSNALKNKVCDLSRTLSNIQTYVKDLKGKKLTVSYVHHNTYWSEYKHPDELCSKEYFLSTNFPKIKD